MKRKKRASSLERDQLILGLKQALGVPAPPPLLFHQELPAPPGCRSLVTQKCHKVGKTSNKFFFCYCVGSYISFPSIRQIIIWPKRDSASQFFLQISFYPHPAQVPVELVKKVPADQCEEVPGVKCFFELVDVEHPVCHEVPVKDFTFFSTFYSRCPLRSASTSSKKHLSSLTPRSARMFPRLSAQRFVAPFPSETQCLAFRLRSKSRSKCARLSTSKGRPLSWEKEGG